MPQTIDSAASINWQRIDASATFRNKTFTGLDLSGRVLAGVDFSGSTFFACDFSNADLSHAKFDGADLYRSAFRRSILYATRFRDCNLTRCDFSESYIYGFKVAESSNVTYARFTNFRLEQQRRSSHLSVSASGTADRRHGGTVARKLRC